MGSWREASLGESSFQLNSSACVSYGSSNHLLLMNGQFEIHFLSRISHVKRAPLWNEVILKISEEQVFLQKKDKTIFWLYFF